MSRGLPNGWTNTTRLIRRYVPTGPFSRAPARQAVNTALRGSAATGGGDGGQEPKRRLRAPYERSARRKSTLRKAGQWTSQK